jgi:hypothetical protein
LKSAHCWRSATRDNSAAPTTTKERRTERERERERKEREKREREKRERERIESVKNGFLTEFKRERESPRERERECVCVLMKTTVVIRLIVQCNTVKEKVRSRNLPLFLSLTFSSKSATGDSPPMALLLVAPRQGP